MSNSLSSTLGTCTIQLSNDGEAILRSLRDGRGDIVGRFSPLAVAEVVGFKLARLDAKKEKYVLTAAGKRWLAKDDEPRLTDLQREALIAYAAEYGHSWKQHLMTDWQFSRARVTRVDRSKDEYRAPLQQVRNVFGPRWLSITSITQIEKGEV